MSEKCDQIKKLTKYKNKKKLLKQKLNNILRFNVINKLNEKKMFLKFLQLFNFLIKS